MPSAFAAIARLLGRYLASLLVIALVLAGGHWLWDRARDLQDARATLASASRASSTLAQQRGQLAAQVQAAVAGAANWPLALLDQRIAALRAAGAGTVQQSSPVSLLRGPAQLEAQLIAHYGVALQAEAARQQLAYLLRLRAHVLAVSSRAEALQQRALLRQTYVDAYASYQRLHDADARDSLFDSVRLQLFDRAALAARRRQLGQAALAVNDAYAAYRAQDEAIVHLAAVGRMPAFVPDAAALDAVTAPLLGQLASSKAALGANPISRVATPVLRQLPLAFAVLASSLALHLALKLLFYYVLAPLAGRRPAIVIDPAAAATIIAGASAVSHSIEVGPGLELIALPEYLQSVPVGAAKDTRWLFDWRMPWTCLVAGMVMLTRVRSSAAVERVVLSSNADPLSEIALIRLPAGAALVLQPRALVGVLQEQTTPLRIARRWRLASLHAWLTLQLRYLVFRGPVTLVVKGTRGVRIETAGGARAISQAATLGFSAQLRYATTRSSTFMPYYLNRSALFDDRFEGEGSYVYAETPLATRGGFVGRGLEGLVDAVLKVFGM